MKIVEKELCRYFLFVCFNWRLITLQYCGGFAIHSQLSAMGVHVSSILNTPSHLPPHPIPQGHPSAPALSTLSHASNLDWPSISHMVIYMFQCYSLKSTPAPLPSPTESKSLFFTSVSLLLSCIQGHHYHLSKFHIYVLIYCIGVFLSDLLHSV